MSSGGHPARQGASVILRVRGYASQHGLSYCPCDHQQGACGERHSLQCPNECKCPNKKHEKTLQTFCREADQAWKDTNNVVFKHQLRYDSQLAGFITLAKGILQEKQDEVWECMQSLVDMAGMPQDTYFHLVL